ncbi:MAG: hypothetical protein J6S67_25605 [Methanobrevibacter sp.]|nr:hypothetical protein [Methanobrevibacter sp.]
MTGYENYRALASAIILQAFEDYCKAIKDGNTGREKECERFLNSNLCDLYNVGDALIRPREIKKAVLAFLKKAERTFDRLNDAGIKECKETPYFKCTICGGDVHIRYGKNGYSKSEKVSYLGYRCSCSKCTFSHYKNYDKRPPKAKKEE